jgi:Holliday junction resolvase
MSASRGAYAERKVRAELEADGYLVKGTGDAHGAVDLVAVKEGRALLVQVKGNLHGGPFMNFRPDERAALLGSARQAGAPCVLIYAPSDRKPPRWIWPRDWP